jgi:hypothetical protein
MYEDLRAVDGAGAEMLPEPAGCGGFRQRKLVGIRREMADGIGAAVLVHSPREQELSG